MAMDSSFSFTLLTLSEELPSDTLSDSSAVARMALSWLRAGLTLVPFPGDDRLDADAGLRLSKERTMSSAAVPEWPDLWLLSWPCFAARS